MSLIEREKIAAEFLRGSGIEIGALHLPLSVPRRARVKYVDRMPVEELRKHYPELSHRRLVKPDVIDDGERLASFADASQDFIIANHFLEHCQDPIGTLLRFERVLKVGAVAYLAVPDMRASFDRDRPATPIEHMARDWREGPEWSRRGHFEEWVRLVQKVGEEAEVEHRIHEYIAMDYSIHYHVWEPTGFLDLICFAIREAGARLEIELFVHRPEELILILRKLDAPPARA